MPEAFRGWGVKKCRVTYVDGPDSYTVEWWEEAETLEVIENAARKMLFNQMQFKGRLDARVYAGRRRIKITYAQRANFADIGHQLEGALIIPVDFMKEDNDVQLNLNWEMAR